MRCLLVLLIGCQAAPSPPREVGIDQQIRQLIDEREAGIGFSPYVTGRQFLPIATSDEQGMVRLGQPPPERSAVLTRLVEAGAAAIPPLVACLEDATPTRLPAMTAMMWSATDDEYDVNRRTTPLPAGVNRDSGPQAPAPYVVSVGDLCFVALGQIVNRSFAAVRYQPTGGLVINSPPSSRALRDAIASEWGHTTAQSLRASLVHDFEQPDHDGRRIGALERLAYYFPDAVAPLVAAELARPTYDNDAAGTFANELYSAPAPARRAMFRTYVAAHGAAASDGLEQKLFTDLETQEAYEQHRVGPQGYGSDLRARECLIALYHRPAGVTSKDQPYPAFSSSAARDRLRATLAQLPRP